MYKYDKICKLIDLFNEDDEDGDTIHDRFTNLKTYKVDELCLCDSDGEFHGSIRCVIDTYNDYLIAGIDDYGHTYTFTNIKDVKKTFGDDIDDLYVGCESSFNQKLEKTLSKYRTNSYVDYIAMARRLIELGDAD